MSTSASCCCCDLPFIIYIFNRNKIDKLMGASINESNFLMKMKNTNNFCSVLPLLCKTKIEKLCSVKEISTKYNIVLIIILHNNTWYLVPNQISKYSKLFSYETEKLKETASAAAAWGMVPAVLICHNSAGWSRAGAELGPRKWNVSFHSQTLTTQLTQRPAHYVDCSCRDRP